jgi:hypothetical protein
VQRFTPLLAQAAHPRRHRVGDRWWVDETYVKVSGCWRYVYRTIDQFGQVIDVYVSTRRDSAAARCFFTRALAITKVIPVEVTPGGLYRILAGPLERRYCCAGPLAGSAVAVGVRGSVATL